MALDPRALRHIQKTLRLARRHRLGAGGIILAIALGLIWSWVERLGVTETCQVVWVADGDTLTLRCGIRSDRSRRIKVRLFGIDAPELAQEPWGRRARDRLKALAQGMVTLETMDRDSYGRIVGKVYKDGQDLGLILVREGYAAVYRRYNDDPAYLEAEAEARRARLGIWSRPGDQQRPWKWRLAHPSFR